MPECMQNPAKTIQVSFIIKVRYPFLGALRLYTFPGLFLQFELLDSRCFGLIFPRSSCPMFSHIY